MAKGPYLQALGPDAVTVKVELDVEAQVVLEIGTPAGPAREVRGEGARRWHALRVTGLLPATTYEYRVRTEGVRSELGRFTTAPSDGRPFRFVVYGDSRSDATAHSSVIRSITDDASDFLVNTGDLVAHGNVEQEWAEYFRIEASLLRDRCLFASVGNHELVGDRDQGLAFLRYFGPEGDGREGTHLFGSFRWSNTRFFLLNAMDDWHGEERAWFARALDESMNEPGLVHRIAVLHHGPFSSGPHGGNPRLAEAGVNTLMREHKVDLVLAGHDHAYERGEGQGLKYIVSGGAGAPLYPREGRAPETLFYESTHHFVDVSVDGEAITTVARRASGGVIERCGFTGAGPWKCDGAGPGAVPSSTVPATAVSGPKPATVPPRGCGCDRPGGEPTSGGASILVAFAWFRRRLRRSSRRSRG